jgi:hypothetical protein
MNIYFHSMSYVRAISVLFATTYSLGIDVMGRTSWSHHLVGIQVLHFHSWLLQQKQQKLNSHCELRFADGMQPYRCPVNLSAYGTDRISPVCRANPTHGEVLFLEGGCAVFPFARPCNEHGQSSRSEPVMDE